MKIAIGCDHRGFDVKTKLIELINRLGHEVTDVGSTVRKAAIIPTSRRWWVVKLPVAKSNGAS